MSYYKPKQCFDENNQILNPQQNPAIWNLGNGMSTLADALEADMQQLHHQLAQIFQALQHPK